MTDSKSSTQGAQPKPAAASAGSGKQGDGQGEGQRGNGGEMAWPGGIDPAAFSTAYGQSLIEMQRQWLEGLGQMQRDYLSFLGERMRKDIEAAKRMAECSDMQAAMELQSAFVATARDDYMEEAQKLLAQGRELTESCIERLAEAQSRDGSASH